MWLAMPDDTTAWIAGYATNCVAAISNGLRHDTPVCPVWPQLPRWNWVGPVRWGVGLKMHHRRRRYDEAMKGYVDGIEYVLGGQLPDASVIPTGPPTK